MYTLSWQRAVALPCLFLALACGPAVAAPAKVAAEPASTPAADTNLSAREVRERFARRQAELEQKKRAELEQVRVKSAACPAGRERNACKQKAGKAHAKPLAEIRKQMVAARLEQELGLSQASMRTDLDELARRPAPSDYAAAKRRQIEAEAQLRKELAMIQADAEIARIDCADFACRRTVSERKKARESAARAQLDIKRLRREARELAPAGQQMPLPSVIAKPAPQ